MAFGSEMFLFLFLFFSPKNVIFLLGGVVFSCIFCMFLVISFFFF